jgi:(S)-ureidoglycine aminohydrolase
MMKSSLMHNLGQTRSANQRDHLLQTPDTFVRIPLPGLTNAVAIVHTGAAAGAAFTQYTAEFEPTGSLASNSFQRFVYVLEGELTLQLSDRTEQLVPNAYAYLPATLAHSFSAARTARAVVIERPPNPASGGTEPALLLSHEDAVASVALMGDHDLQARSLLPEHPALNFAVNTMTYQPGAALSQVEIHIMEHGLLMLEGGGIYRLGDCWYPVTAGDFIWMAPSCPQWFGALGKKPAKYLIYKDWNQHPLR